MLDRVGEQSYIVQLSPNRTFEVHRSHMKLFTPDLTGDHIIDLFHFLPTHEEVEVTPHEWTVNRIVRHRKGKDGRPEF